MNAFAFAKRNEISSSALHVVLLINKRKTTTMQLVKNQFILTS